MKRILASILATSMALSLVAMPISATEQVNGSDFTTSAVEFVTEQQVDSDFSATLEEDFSQVEILDAGTFLAMAEDLQEIQQETLHVSQYQAGYFEYKEIISPQYQDGGMFSVNDGLAPVKLNGKWGYINTDNQVIVPFNYDFAAIFNEGHAIVGTTASGGYAMGMVDTTGRYTPILKEDGSALVADSSYISVPFTIFHNGLCTQMKYTSGGTTYGVIVDKSGKAISVAGATLTLYNEGVIVANTTGGKAQVLNQWGGLIWEIGSYTAYSINKGIIPIQNSSSKHGFVNYANRSVAISPIYSGYASSARNTYYEVFGSTGLAMVNNGSNSGGIDGYGNTVIPFSYSSLFNISEGRFLFEKSSKWGYLDENYNVVIPATYTRGTSFSGGMAAVKSGTSFYLIDSKGNKIEGSELLDGDIYFASSTGYTNPTEFVNITSGGKTGYGQVIYYPELPVKGDTSDWALDKVISAILAHLVPSNQQNTYFSNVTREDFALLAIISLAERFGMSHDTYVKAKTGKTMNDWVNSYPFNDTNNQYVVSAFAMGIVNGKGEGKYDPYAYITRQEVAVIMEGMARMINESYSAPAYPFTDRSDIATWALSQVDYAAAEGIMSDTGGGYFSPHDYCTREQTFTILYNFYANL